MCYLKIFISQILCLIVLFATYSYESGSIENSFMQQSPGNDENNLGSLIVVLYVEAKVSCCDCSILHKLSGSQPQRKIVLLFRYLYF